MRLFSFIAALLLFIFGPAAAVLAHDVLVDQDPADHAVLETAPDQITLTFNNSLIDLGEGATVMNVLDVDGNVVIDATPTLSGFDAVQTAEGLTDGAYRLIWRVVSSDGHPISGSSTFAIGADGASLLEEMPPLEGLETPAEENTKTDEESGESESSFNLPSAATIFIAIAVTGTALTLVVMMVRKSRPGK